MSSRAIASSRPFGSVEDTVCLCTVRRLGLRPGADGLRGLLDDMYRDIKHAWRPLVRVLAGFAKPSVVAVYTFSCLLVADLAAKQYFSSCESFISWCKSYADCCCHSEDLTPFGFGFLFPLSALPPLKFVWVGLFSLYSWGSGGSGQLGNNATTDLHAPPSSDILVNATSVMNSQSFTCASMISGGARWYARVCLPLVWMSLRSPTLCCRYRSTTVPVWLHCSWGWNANGQLGIGTTTDVHLPPSTDMPGLNNGSTITSYADVHACAWAQGKVQW